MEDFFVVVEMLNLILNITFQSYEKYRIYETVHHFILNMGQ